MSENRLLLIDDDRVFSMIVTRAGEACGYEVTALTQLKSDAVLQQIDPTVIVLDLIMPGQDGIEVMRLLGASRNRAPIIIISVADEKIISAAQMIGSAIGLQIAGTFSKPISVEGLHAVLNEFRHKKGAPQPS
jgi:CheY-like chemotaxis protein